MAGTFMKIIRATALDVHRIIPLADKFCRVLGVNLNPWHYTRFWKNQIGNHTGAMFLVVDGESVRGGIGGITSVEPLSGEVEAVEMFWFMDEEYRSGLWSIRLLKELESWAKQMHCKHMSMIAMEDSMREQLEKFYGRTGYRRFETIYRKTIS